MLLITALLVTNAAALAPPLRTLLSRSAKPKAREDAITLITEMEREERDKFLDYVNTVRETPSKLARRPLMRYAPISWPARDVAALDRVLAIGGVPEDDASKRRVVLSTLRQLANTRGVLKLEREARRRARLSASFDEMLERTPKISTPAFEIVEEQDAFQVRKYDDFAVVRTARQRAVSDDGVKLGEPKMSGAGAFQALAGYIFGKNKREEKMAMTTPVFTRAGQMEFVLPAEYWKDLGKAPAPVSNVEITYGEGGLVAAAYYGGYATKDEVAKRSAELVAAIEASDYAVAGETYSAAYNDPFTPPWRRRNEVLVAVQQKAGAPPTRPSTVTLLSRHRVVQATVLCSLVRELRVGRGTCDEFLRGRGGCRPSRRSRPSPPSSRGPAPSTAWASRRRQQCCARACRASSSRGPTAPFPHLARRPSRPSGPS